MPKDNRRAQKQKRFKGGKSREWLYGSENVGRANYKNSKRNDERRAIEQSMKEDV